MRILPRFPTRSNLALVLAASLALWLSAGSASAQQGGTRSRSSSTTTYPGATEVGTAMITSDAETRKLIVVTDEETAKHIGQIVTNLDRAVPQVLIKVVFLEVTYRKGLDLGVEGSYGKNMGNSTTGSISQAFGLAAAGNAAVPGAGLYQLASDDFTVTLRAIATAGKTEVLSRPSVLARNNQQATITVGQQVPLITNVRYDNFGNQINAVTYTSVGIILRVTPFITDDGLVEMVVSPEISNLSDKTVAISKDVNAPVINSRSADTVVVTPNGQTVVIGGLMQNAKTESDSKIPWLGDIPGLGALFKRRNNTGEKTELLIFLTPHIVQQPRQLAGIAAQDRANLQLVPQSFSEQELNRYLDNVPVKDPATETAPATSSSKKKSSRSGSR